MSTQVPTPVQPVDNPIICSPYVEPTEHWVYRPETGEPYPLSGRRPASYYYKTSRTGTAQTEMFAEEERDDLPLVNVLRDDVKRWREAEYRGTSNVTRELLKWWSNSQRDRRLFYCQLEAVETIIYLAEIRIPGRASATGFKNFALSEENLARLLVGEKPEGERFQFAAGSTFFPRLCDQPIDAAMLPLRRLGCKMATGSGKTVVMAMLISWAFCNRATNPTNQHFPGAALVCCPNLTVKERLQVLRTDIPDNYYVAFDLVPVNLRPHLMMGKVIVENWHKFAPESEHREGDKSYAVVDKGPETHETLARRVLGELFDRMPIMVLNDEGHHCWRPAVTSGNVTVESAEPPRRGRRRAEPDPTEVMAAGEDEEVEARVWLNGLDRINNCLDTRRPGIAFCVDLSATPFYLGGSGYPEGQPFPWLVSDFGLVDAIESGIVKIPRLPIVDDSGKRDEVGRPDPKYFRLWHHIMAALQPRERYSSGKPRPDACYREAEGALKLAAGQWLERFKRMLDSKPGQEIIPPVLILVCDNTEIADYFFGKISGESEDDAATIEDLEESDDEEEAPTRNRTKPKKKVVYGPSAILQEFANTSSEKHTIRIDSRLLAEAESGDGTTTKQKLAEEIRRVVATVGKRGEPGEFVRCVVSVSMLTEGWDANNVTQILGVRAFGSQLLCEQVVGRGLRRMNYRPNEHGLLDPEYVDVYGIPFSVIPFKGRAAGQSAGTDDDPPNHVFALPDREEWEMRFPIVNGYVMAFHRGLIRCDVDGLEPVQLNKKLEPSTTFLRPLKGYVDTQANTNSFEFVQQDRSSYYDHTHSQTILFQIAQKIVGDLLSATAVSDDKRARVFRLQSRHQLFPQVLRIVQEFVARKVVLSGHDPREIGLEKYTMQIVERVRTGIVPNDLAGEPPLLPTLDRYRPAGSTKNVDFTTRRAVVPTLKSHINQVVLHSDWEGEAARIMDEQCEFVQCNARNDHLGLVISYEFMGGDHDYTPDFLVRLDNGLTILLEVKGPEIYNPGQIDAKHAGARRWIAAVNNLGDFGKYDLVVCRELAFLKKQLEEKRSPVATKALQTA